MKHIVIDQNCSGTESSRLFNFVKNLWIIKNTLFGGFDDTALDDVEEYEDDDDDDDIDWMFDLEEERDLFVSTFGESSEAPVECSGNTWLRIPRRA